MVDWRLVAVLALVCLIVTAVLMTAHAVPAYHYPATWAYGASGPMATPVVP